MFPSDESTISHLNVSRNQLLASPHAVWDAERPFRGFSSLVDQPTSVKQAQLISLNATEPLNKTNQYVLQKVEISITKVIFSTAD